MSDRNPIQTQSASDFNCLLEEANSLKRTIEKIAKLMDSQREAIEARDLETLEAVLKQKQAFIDQLLLYKRMKARYDLYISSNFPTPDMLTTAYSELEEKIQALVGADQQAIDILKERHAEMAKDLQILMRDRQAMNCYSSHLQGQSKPRIDISG